MLRRRVVVVIDSPPAVRMARCRGGKRRYRIIDAGSITVATTRQTAAAAAAKGRRRRRSPESAEREILQAAEDLLRERPFRDLTVDEVMARTTLSRPSFYVYFRDRHQLAVRLVEEIGAELFAMADRWLEGGGDPRADVRAALEGVAAVYAEHGLVLTALADATVYDPDVAETYGRLVDAFVVATAEHIEQEIATGRIAPLDAGETARALIWMNERYLIETLGREPQAPLETVVDTLWAIWVRALYGPA
jgi:TetR/AcrR family transcriptional regulator, ethionamide resistance regulator